MYFIFIYVIYSTIHSNDLILLYTYIYMYREVEFQLLNYTFMSYTY